MTSQNGLRANFAQTSSPTFQIVFTDNLKREECYLHMTGIPNKELADTLVTALQAFHVERETGTFSAEPEEFDMTQTLVKEQDNTAAPKRK